MALFTLSHLQRNKPSRSECERFDRVGVSRASCTLRARVTTDFTIRADGKVSSAAARGVHKNVESCMVTALKAISFPKAEPTTPDVTVSVPITFTAVK